MKKSAVAQAIGVNAATLWRWEREEAFRTTCGRELHDALGATRSLVVDGRLRALRLLVDAVDNTSLEHRDRIAAARALLNACPPPEAATPPAELKREQEPIFSPEEALFVAHQILEIRRREHQRQLGIDDENE